MKRIRKRYIVIAILILIMMFSIITNPAKQDYLQFSEERSGVPTPTEVEIERINFYLFSTYTPILLMNMG